MHASTSRSGERESHRGDYERGFTSSISTTSDEQKSAPAGRAQHLSRTSSSSESASNHGDVSLETRLEKIDLKLDKLPTPQPFATGSGLPSPFAHGLSPPPSFNMRADKGENIHGKPLKLDTTPEALESADYMSLRRGSQLPQHSAPVRSSSTSKPWGRSSSSLSPDEVTTPQSAASQRSATMGGQAADMQQRILAMQRSRSKRVASSAGGAPSPQSNSMTNLSLPPITQRSRRSSSTSSGATVGATHPLARTSSTMSSSRSSVSTVDSFALETDEEEAFSGSPMLDQLDEAIEIKPITLGQPPDQIVNRPSSPQVPPVPSIPKQPTASNGFDPNTVISPTAASIAAAGGAFPLARAPSFRSKQRSSLSARRGMRLDTSALQVNGTVTNSAGEGMPEGFATKSMAARLASENRDGGQGMPQDKNNNGFFRDYRKYIDIKTGSLNFTGKACVHAKGIEFSSGERFSISMDKLEFLGELGAGNYGTVQKVLHTPNNVLMAVKEIRLELDESALRQIIMELDVLHRCEMQNIIAFYGAFFVEGSVYICMEYMDGGSVNKTYQGGIPERYLQYIVRSVVHGLKHLKEQFNIIHRDVKPTNILCSSDGQVKLCDFGVSGNLVSSMARTNVGCQAYMAPERIKVDRFTTGNPNEPMTYTAESDIWSLGLSIIEMAKGSYPYPPDSYQSIFSQLNAIVEDPSPALDPKQFSPEACDFVSKLLNKSPSERPRYSDIVEHPWLTNIECTPEEMGEFVRERIANTAETGNFSGGPEQPTVTPQMVQ